MKEYIFYGAVDLCTTIIERAMAYVEKLGGNVVCFIDDNPEKQADSRYPRKVYGKNILKDYPSAIIVILSSAVKEICDELKRNGFDNKVLAYPLFRWWFPCSDIVEVNQYINNWTEKNTEKLRDIYQLEDGETERILSAIVEQRKMKEFDFVDVNTMFGFHYKEYFNDSTLRPDENDLTIMDCGAYQGDSLSRMLSIFGERVKKSYAVEPDADNIRVAKQRLSNINSVEYIEAGVAADNGICRFSSNEMNGQLTDDGDVEVSVQKIDSIIHEVNGKLCITMDVEGNEVAAIKGGTEVIRKYRPYIIACLYHKPKDVLEVPEAIKEICADYDFYLRAGTHTECYAIPRKTD